MFTVYNVDFETKSDFFSVLGYAHSLSPAVLKRQYNNSYEQVVKSRLKADTDDQAREMLQALKDKAQNIDYEKECFKVAWKMLDAERQEIIMQTVAALNNINVSELKKKIGL